MSFTKIRWLFYLISGALIIFSIFSLIYYPLQLGIDFKGGIRWEFEVPQSAKIKAKQIIEQQFPQLEVQLVKEGLLIRGKEVDKKLITSLLEKAKIQIKEISFEEIGPLLTKEFRKKALTAVILVLIIISIYVSFAFRKVDRPVNNFFYGLATLIALAHDVIISLGIYSFLSRFTNYQADINLIVALLVVAGFSVHDTIVVFDRIRENLQKENKPFQQLVDLSINQTITRSLNTSLTSILVVIPLTFLLDFLRPFLLVYIVGFLIGTYSSICLASQFLVEIAKIKEK